MNKYFVVGENIVMGSYVSERRDGKLYKSYPNELVMFQTPQALNEGDTIRINEHGAIDVGISNAKPITATEVMMKAHETSQNAKVYSLAKWLYEMYQSKARIFDLIGALDNTPFEQATEQEVKTFLAMGLEVKTIFDQVASTGTPLNALDFTKHCPYYNPDCPICPKDTKTRE